MSPNDKQGPVLRGIKRYISLHYFLSFLYNLQKIYPYFPLLIVPGRFTNFFHFPFSLMPCFLFFYFFNFVKSRHLGEDS